MKIHIFGFDVEVVVKRMKYYKMVSIYGDDIVGWTNSNEYDFRKNDAFVVFHRIKRKEYLEAMDLA